MNGFSIRAAHTALLSISLAWHVSAQSDTIQISQDTHYLELRGTTQARVVTGGRIKFLFLRDSASISIEKGGAAENVKASHAARVEIRGGHATELTLEDDSSALLDDAVIDGVVLLAPHAHIDLEATAVSLGGTLSGAWQSSGRFEILVESVLPGTRVTQGQIRVAGSGPTFNCFGVRWASEQLICDSPELAAQDRRLAELYARAVVARPALNLRHEQRTALARRNECNDVDCVATWYRERISAISAVAKR